MENIDIYCVTNKKVPFLEKSFLKLGAVGNEDFDERYIKCDSKDNIFNKEKYYSELTFQYWYWKNELKNSSFKWIGFCQRRRFWIKKNSVGEVINKENIKDHLLKEVPDEWKSYNAIVCEPISVSKLKKIKILKRGMKSFLKKPSILFNEKKRTLKLHFDMFHGHGNMDKAIDKMNDRDKNDFRNFMNNNNKYNPHIMFISTPEITNSWFESLFTWLFKCEDIFKFEDLKGYETERIYAYLSERYLSFWFNKYSKVLPWPWRLVE